MTSASPVQSILSSPEIPFLFSWLWGSLFCVCLWSSVCSSWGTTVGHRSPCVLQAASRASESVYWCSPLLQLSRQSAIPFEIAHGAKRYREDVALLIQTFSLCRCFPAAMSQTACDLMTRKLFEETRR